MADLYNEQLYTVDGSDRIFPAIDIEDNLESTSTTAALSANQGRVLKGLIDGLNNFTYQVVSSLPDTGEPNILYLVPNDGESGNVYNEYLWLSDSSSYELIGALSTEVDLSSIEQNIANLQSSVSSLTEQVNGITNYGNATSTTYGVVKLGSDTAQSVAANAVSSTTSRTYAVQNNSSGQLVVNVPWTDTNTTYSEVTTTANGLMTSSDKVKLDGIAEGADVTTVSPTLTSGTLIANINGVNVYAPTAGESVTYDQATSSILGLVRLGSDTVQTVAANNPTTSSSRTYPIQVNSSGQMVVNVPWANTTYTAATTSSNGLMSSTDKANLEQALIDIAQLKEDIQNISSSGLNIPDGYELVLVKTS